MENLYLKRYRYFRKQKRSFYSFILLCFFIIVSFFAEFIANEKPILVHFNHSIYMPVFRFYSEKDFGGEFETEANYKDPFVQKLIESKGWILWAPIPFSHDTIQYDLPGPAPTPPSRKNWLGTDDQGRDVCARLIYGFRLSFVFAFLLTIFTTALGITLGGIQGYFGGKIDLIGQRLTEIWSGLPMLYILIILSSFVSPHFGWLLLIMLLFSWIQLANLVRAEFLRARQYDYVKAAKALGVSSFTIMWRHVLPNAMIATLTLVPFLMNGAIGTLASLDLLGFGLPPGSPSLGEMLSQGKNNLSSPWLGLTGFLTIATLLSLLVFIGEGIRNAFDPRNTRS
jgi:microcin C transport system permease protein